MAELGVLQVQIAPDFGNFSSEVSKSMGSIASGMAGISKRVGADMVNIGTSMVTASAIGIGAAATVGIKMAASLETAQLQFQTLTGSADKAHAKVQQLFDFAKRTPFESGPVIEAARRLETFGGAALDTEDNLTRIGNAAASVSAPIEDVASWVGRMYSQVKAGRPFGEAAMRLQELGVLGPDVTNKMMDLAKQGGNADEVWKLLTGSLDKFNGAMDRQQHTLSGLVSTVKDQISLGLATAFTPALKAIEAFLETLSKFADSQAFGAIADDIGQFVALILGSLTPAVDGISKTFEGLSKADVDVAFAKIEKSFASFIGDAEKIYDALKPVAPLLGGIAGAFLSVRASGIPLFGLLFPQISGLTGALLGLTLLVKDNRDAMFDFFKVISGAAKDTLPAVSGALKIVGDTINTTFQGVLEGIAPGIASFTRDVLPALADGLARIAPPLGEVVVQLAKLAGGVISSIGPTLAAIANGVSAILSAGLSTLASILRLMNDNIGSIGPALGALAIAFAGMRIAAWVQQLGLVQTAFSGLKILIGDVRLMMEMSAGQGFFASIVAGADGAKFALSGLKTSFESFAILLVLDKVIERFQKEKRAADEMKSTTEQLTGQMEEFGATARTAMDFLGKMADQHPDIKGALDTQGMDDFSAALRGTDDQWRSFVEGVVKDRNKHPIWQFWKDGMDGGEGMVKSLEDVRNEWINAKGGVDRLGQSQEEQKAKQEASKQATDEYIGSLQRLRDALDDAAGKTLAQNEAQIRFLDGTDSLVQKLGEVHAAQGLVKGSFDLTTEAGRRGADVITQSIQNFNGLKDAVLSSGDSADVMKQKMDNAYLTLVNKVSVGMGITTTAAMNLLKQLGLIPGDYNAQITADSKQASAQAKSIRDQLKNIDDTKAVADIEAALDSGDFVKAQAMLDAWNQAHATATLTFKVVAQPVQDALNKIGLGNLGPIGRVAGLSAPPGVPMMPAAMAAVEPMTPQALGASNDFQATVWLRPRVLGGANALNAPTQQAQQPVMVESKIFVGNQQITDIVRQEARVIGRDRSMAFIGGVPG